jgi:hypothetical protein
MRLLTALIILSASISSWAIPRKSVTCHTPMSEKILKIDSTTINVATNKKEENRSIASIIKIRTLSTENGFTKVFKFKNLDAKVHVENLKKPNEADDYFSLTSKKGHQMTYPINCELD